jgi:dUTP pyrophosphatase
MRIAKLDERAIIPTRKNPRDAGLDLHTLDGVWVEPLEYGIVKTGIVVEIPRWHIGWITNKSSKNYLIGGGIIDEGYRGEILVKIINTTNNTISMAPGLPIAQLLIIPVKIFDVHETSLEEILEQETDRMDDGGIGRQLTQEEIDNLPKDDDMGYVDSRIYDWTDERAWCGECGEEMQGVRPGKHQCINCELNWTEEDDYDYTLDDFNFDSMRERE